MSDPSVTQQTSSVTAVSRNPFDDDLVGSDVSRSPSTLDCADVLTVHRNATLTLGTDSLVVLDEGLREATGAADCCGLLRSNGKSTRAIPFYTVLWAEVSGLEVTVQYVQVSKGFGALKYINYTIADKDRMLEARTWVERLLSKAYPSQCKRRKRFKVLINPFGGKGHAPKLWARDAEPLLAAARCDLDIERTNYRGHAAEIAQKLDLMAYDAVLCASGDGLPHEVFNGLARRGDGRKALRHIAVAQIPCGSGNALSMNMNGTISPSLACLAVIKGVKTPLDLTAITQGDKKYYSFCSQAVGIIAETDLGTESLRWMGPLRFTWGLIVRLLSKTLYPAKLAVAVETDDKVAIREDYNRAREQALKANASGESGRRQRDEMSPSREDEDSFLELRYGTVKDDLPSNFTEEDQSKLGNFYAGNMCWMAPDAPFFPASLPSDGKLDLMTIDGDTPRMMALQMITALESGALLNFEAVRYRKISGYRIDPSPPNPEQRKTLRDRFVQTLGGSDAQNTEGYISIDGERVPFEPFQAEVVPALATVLCKTRGLYEYKGPKIP